jgi:hypothetical protein
MEHDFEEIDFRLVKEHSSFEQDLSEFKAEFLRMHSEQRERFKKWVNEITVLDNFPGMNVRIDFFASSRHQEDDYKRPHLKPSILKQAIAAWDQREEVAPATEDVGEYLMLRDL